MPCPYLEFRTSAGDQSFERERPYCSAAASFVQAMRADICNERYDLVPETDCEIFREHEGREE